MPTETQISGEDIQTGLEGALNLDGAGSKEYPVLNGFNLGSSTLLLAMPMHEFHDRSFVANQRNVENTAAFANEPVAQRKLDPNHTLGLAKYILKGLFAALGSAYERKGKVASQAFHKLQEKVGLQPYLSLQPITANIRACKKGGTDLKFRRTADNRLSVFLSNNHILWVVDGQHRREAMNLLNEFLKEVVLKHQYPKRPAIFSDLSIGEAVPPDELGVWNEINETARGICTVMVEVHLGLDAVQERQLFYDLNNYTKKVEASLAFSFDQANPINLFIKEELIGNRVLIAPVSEKDKLDWHEDNGEISRKDLVAINALLFLNKTNIKGASAEQVDQLKNFAISFWKAVSEIPNFGIPGSKKATVAAQPVVLKALAKLAYSFKYGRRANTDEYTLFMTSFKKMDFSHSNKIWRYYLYDAAQREAEFPGLAAFLPSEENANRDIGQFSQADQVFRFGAKHNDIYPIIGDMVRWTLKLSNRQQPVIFV
jgi:DNA-sulfur modification-associated